MTALSLSLSLKPSKNGKMQATIAICTWNRSQLLNRTLASVVGLDVAGVKGWEVLVVNNNCTDDSHRIIESYLPKLPLRVVDEPRQGKSYALNSAIAHARGEFLLWTDDDVVVDPHWLRAHLECATTQPRCSFFGGPIEPCFDTPLPSWVVAGWSHLKPVYVDCDYGARPRSIDHTCLPYGANLMVRTAVQRRFPYRLDLGRIAAAQVRGEETDVVRRMLADGQHGYWVPAARVRHMNTGERLSLEYVRTYYEGIGLSESRWKRDAQRGWLDRLCRRSAMRLRWCVATARYSVAQRRSAEVDWNKQLVKASYLKGRMNGFLKGEHGSEHQLSETSWLFKARPPACSPTSL